MATTIRKDEKLTVIAVSRAVRDKLKKHSGESYDNTIRGLLGMKPTNRRRGRPPKKGKK